MTCNAANPKLVAFLLGELSPRQVNGIASHVRVCSDCLADLDSLSRTVSLLQGLPQSDVSPSFDSKLARRLNAARAGVLAHPRPVPAAPLLRTRWAPYALASAVAASLLILVALVARPHTKAGSLGVVSAPSLARAVRVTGRPLIRRAEDSEWEPCRENSSIPAGSELTTRDTDRAELELADGSRVSLDFDTRVRLLDSDAPERTPRPELHLEKGRAWLLLTPSRSKLVVQTPSARAEALGTAFVISVAERSASPAQPPKGPQPEPTALTGVTVLRGAVRLVNSYGGVTARQGTYTEASPGQAPRPPRPSPSLQTVRVQAPWGQTVFQVSIPPKLDLAAASARLAAPGDDPALLAANRLLTQGKPAEADARYRALPGADNRADVWNNRGVVRQVDDDLMGAVSAYREAVRIEPDLPLYRFNLAMGFYGVGNLVKSAALLESVLSLDPEFPNVRFTLGRSYGFLGDFEAAGEQARKLQAQAHTRALGYCLAGELLRFQGKNAEAKAWYLRAVREDPSYPDAAVYLAAAYLVCGDLDAAQRSAQVALELDPSSLRGLNLLGLILMRKAKLDEAERVLVKGVTQHPDSGESFTNLGQVYLKKKDLAAATNSYRQAARLSPHSIYSHLGLGVALERSGSLPEAKQQYLAAVRLDPTFQESYQRLASLHRQMGQTQLAEAVLDQARKYAL